jgi:hypothetical protein
MDHYSQKKTHLKFKKNLKPTSYQYCYQSNNNTLRYQFT